MNHSMLRPMVCLQGSTWWWVLAEASGLVCFLPLLGGAAFSPSTDAMASSLIDGLFAGSTNACHS